MQNRKLEDLYIETPLILSEPMSRIGGNAVTLKMEALQPSGSFKNRGIGNYCLRKAQDGAKEFICSSGGNAGLAAAYAARKLGVPITVVIPETTPSMMIDKIKCEKASVKVHGKDWQEANEHVLALCERKGACYVPPFDHPYIWEGNATMIKEVVDTGWKPDLVVLSVGGGGLLCGVIQGMHQVGWEKVPVIAVETEGAASFAAAMKAGKVVELEKVDTLATSLAARYVTEQVVKWSKKHTIVSKVVTDKAAVDACLLFSLDHRFLVEPACGTAFAPIYDQDPDLNGYHNILVIACGGVGVNLQLLEKWSQVV